jgi:RNA polymerase sigma-70 factor (ECF subfamily)
MNKENFSDSEIILKVLNGDSEKFAVLVERYERLVFSFLLTRLKNLEEVEDIVQDTFVKAFRHLKSFDRSKKFTAWLLTIARNILVDFLRKSSKTVASTDLVTDVLLKKDKSEENNPQNLAVRRESFRRIIETIDSLPEDVKEPFMLRVVNDMSYKEISDTLELPLQTVKNKIFKARSLLRGNRNRYEEMSRKI